MSRIKKSKPNRFEDGARASIGDYYVEKACEELNKAALKEAHMFVAGMTAREVVPMLFHDDVVAKLEAVHDLLSYEQFNCNYNLQSYTHASIVLQTHGWMPCPHPTAIYWQEERAAPLSTALATLTDLHLKWGAVKHLLRWFNRHATIGAVRALWPSVLQLCPDSPALKNLTHSPQRYTNPQGLSALLPLIRSTSATVASMAMIPGDASPRQVGTVRIVLPKRTATYDGAEIDLDEQWFAL